MLQCVAPACPCLAEQWRRLCLSQLKKRSWNAKGWSPTYKNATELKETAQSHELHDDLGGLMGAAVMDLEAVRRVTPALSQNALTRVDRVKKTLEQAIDLERRVIEELRPSILDNFGLFAALRWQLN